MDRLPVDRVVSGMHQSVRSMHRHATEAFVERDPATAAAMVDDGAAVAAKRALVDRYASRAARPCSSGSDAVRSRYTVWANRRVACSLERFAAAATVLVDLAATTDTPPTDWTTAFEERAEATRSALETAVRSTLPVEMVDPERAHRAAGTCERLDDLVGELPDCAAEPAVTRATASLRRSVAAATAVSDVSVEAAYWNGSP